MSIMESMNDSDRRISSHNSLSNTTQSMVDQLRNENELLKTKIKRIEENTSHKRGAVEMDNIVKTKFELEEELELSRKESRLQIERLSQTLQDREEELIRKRHEFLAFQKEVVLSRSDGFSNTDQESARRVREQIERLTKESENEALMQRRIIQQQIKELESATSELEITKANERKHKHRIKQLEIELETSVRRVSSRGTTDRLYSPYTRNTPNSANNKRSTSVPTVKSYSPAARTPLQRQPLVSRNPLVTNPRSQNNSNNSRSSSNKAGLSPSYQVNARKNASQNNLNKNIFSNTNNKFGNRISPSSTNLTNQRAQNNNTFNSRKSNSPLTGQNVYGNSNRTNNQTKSTSGISGTIKRDSPSNRIGQYGQQQKQSNVTNRLSPANYQNRNSKISPDTRFKGTTLQTNSRTKESPNARVNNYTSSGDSRILKRIDEIQYVTKNNNNLPSREHQDFRFNNQNDTHIEEIDSRLSKLQNLLKMAKN